MFQLPEKVRSSLFKHPNLDQSKGRLAKANQTCKKNMIYIDFLSLASSGTPLLSMVVPFRVAYDLRMQCRTESKAIIENHQMWWALRKANFLKVPGTF